VKVDLTVPGGARCLAGLALLTMLGRGASAAETDAPRLTEQLELDVGGNRSLHVVLRHRQLEVREVGGFGPHQGEVFRSDTLSPSVKQWTEFWREMDKLGVWEWETTLRSAKSAQTDGVAWSLKLAHDGQRVESRGYNAYPDTWPAFLLAIERLTSPPNRPGE